jgi:2-polyprenyl-3-methyl-5-hydroxy-6-metoxy-1,4-benzoquinol methylase
LVVLQPSIEFTLEDQRQMTRATNYFAWQSRLVVRELGRRVVEVGCGIGNFTSLLLDREVVVALDCEEACVESLRERYPGQRNLHAFTCDAGSAAFRGLARFQPDSVVCLNVLEHIEDDRAALRGMAEIVVPGGVIVLLVPAFQALYGPIDRNLGHYRRYRRGSLAELAHTAGLEIVKLHYMNAVGFFGWWVNARLLKRETQSDGQIAVFDRLIVPVSSALEGAIPPPFGQSLLAVLRRPVR